MSSFEYDYDHDNDNDNDGAVLDTSGVRYMSLEQPNLL
jgi:hypothetical protein